MKSIQRIRGEVGPQTLRKAHQLFRQDIATILSEMFQNSRRAGATKIELETSGGAGRGYLTIRDDGAGLDDLQKIVTFGQSGWDDALAATENAAGMGSYSIASRGGTFRSNGRRVSIGEAVFLGEEEAVVLDDPEPIAGMEITIPLLAQGSQDERSGLERQVQAAAMYHPLPVTLDGVAMERQRFTARCAHVEAWQGVLIGIMQIGDANRITGRNGGAIANINFHGHTLGNADLLRAPHMEMQRGWAAFVDVVDAPDLKLVLPTRNAVIENDFWHRLIDTARQAGLRCVAKQEWNTLPMATRAMAAKQGIDVPLPAIRLQGIYTLNDCSSWRYEERGTGDVTDVALDDVVLFGNECQVTTDALDTTLESQARAGMHFMQANEAYEGHPTYDAIPRLASTRVEMETASGVRAAIDLGCGHQELEDFQTLAGFEHGGVETTSLKVVATIRNADGTTREASGEAKTVILAAHANNPTDVVFATRQGTSPHDVTSTFADLYFDGDRDLTDTEFYDQALEHFSRILETPEDAEMTLLENFLRDNKAALTERGFTSISMKVRSRPLWKGSTAMERTVIATVRSKKGPARTFTF